MAVDYNPENVQKGLSGMEKNVGYMIGAKCKYRYVNYMLERWGNEIKYE